MADAIKVKVVILGDTCVGKSCFLMRFVNNAVTQNHISTIGVDVRNKTLVTKKGKVNLQIWDTAGQEKFRSLSPSYLRNTDSVILLYDITNQETFDHVTNWMATINQYTTKNLSTILVGNKIDMENERKVEKEDGEIMAKQYNIMFGEASAKEGKGVDEIFERLANDIMEKNGKGSENNEGGVTLEKGKKKDQKGCCGGNRDKKE